VAVYSSAAWRPPLVRLGTIAGGISGGPTGMTIMPMVDTERRTAPTEGAFYGAANL
jgi:hypothetical protein